MKISISLPDESVVFLDTFADAAGETRSATVNRAIRLLQQSSLGSAYEAAWSEWSDSPDADLWNRSVDDEIMS